MNFFKRLMKGHDENVVPRVLDHPENLQMGDIIKFGFCGIDDLSNATTVVKEINTYDLNANLKKTVFTLDAAGTFYFLSVQSSRAGETLEIGKLILPPVVDQLFTFDQFANIIESESVDGMLTRKNEPDEVAGWTTETYYQEAYNEAYFHSGDYREKSLPLSKDPSSAFDYYAMVSQDRKYAVQIEVHDGSRTDVLLLVYLPLRSIEEMWPAKG
ncbi:MAG: hypothetical protein GXP14_10760 [Gammaproteobacteria bacterium]|nr:hypothetical protein [Gammaproteobacteria bacterium]